MREEQSERLAASIVEFCRFAGAHGLSRDLRRTLTALEAAKMIGTEDRETFAFVLQAALCSSREEWDLFLQLFEEFWGESRPTPKSASRTSERSREGNAQEQEVASTVFLDQPANEAASRDGERKAVYGASAQARLKKMDFSGVPLDDLAALEELSVPFAADESTAFAKTYHQQSRRPCRSPQKHPAKYRLRRRANLTGLQSEEAEEEQAAGPSRHQRLDEFLQSVPVEVYLRSAGAFPACGHVPVQHRCCRDQRSASHSASDGSPAKTLGASNGLVGRY